MEIIYSARYEGDERKGRLYDDPEELAQSAEETPSTWFRPLEWEYCNEGEPPEEMYA
jgi:hypothetical protein